MKKTPVPVKKPPTGYINSKQSNSDVGLKRLRLLIYLFCGLLFGLSLLLLIVGIIYLSIYFYQYSFTEFSTTLVAALFVTFSGLIIIIIGANIFLALTSRIQIVLFTTIFVLLLFLVLVGIGIWGLVISVGYDDLSSLVKQNILDTVKIYDPTQPNTCQATSKIDWLQSTFDCCGIDSSLDWQVFYKFRQGYYQNQYNYNQYNPYSPYTNTVPDSCCVQWYYGCGQVVNYQNSGIYYRQNNINRQGCLNVYLQKYQKDLVFMAAYCFGVSTFGAILCLIYIAFHFILGSRNQ